MKPKHPWSMRINSSFKSPSASTTPTSPSSPSVSPIPASSSSAAFFPSSSADSSGRRHPARHLSLSHASLLQKQKSERQCELERAVAYCKEKGCKGYQAITDLKLKIVKDARTTNNHLSKKYQADDDKKILTDKEEKSLVRYLVNRNHACQGLSQAQVSGVAINILKVRQKRNRQTHRGNPDVPTWKYTPLSTMQKKSPNWEKRVALIFSPSQSRAFRN